MAQQATQRANRSAALEQIDSYLDFLPLLDDLYVTASLEQRQRARVVREHLRGE